MTRWLLAVFAATATSGVAGADRPNIVWIVTEDISPNLGCYGDKWLAVVQG